jgi:hypothetical protein
VSGNSSGNMSSTLLIRLCQEMVQRIRLCQEMVQRISPLPFSKGGVTMLFFLPAKFISGIILLTNVVPFILIQGYQIRQIAGGGEGTSKIFLNPKNRT